MADVQSAAQWIGKLLAKEVEYLARVRVQVKELQDELEWMHCFLRGADASQLNNSMARKWVAQIRELAYEAEDTLEKFLVNNRGGGYNFNSMLRKKISGLLWKVVSLHKIGHKIEKLKRKMSLLTTRLSTYGINLKLEDSSTSWLLNDHETYFKAKEEKLIGREVDVVNLVHKLTYAEVDIVNAQVASAQPSSSNIAPPLSLEAKSESRVFAICGTAGVGKTSVAKEIFHHREVRRSYEAFAWASVSQPCQFSAVQQELLGSLTSKSREQITQMSDDEMKNELRRVQRKKKCFIVLDGVRSKEVWDHLQEAFPMTDYEFKSKLLLTAREKDVAKHIHQFTEIHDLQCLKKDQSILLLEDRIRGAPILPADEKEEVDKLKEKMVNHCEHLPLAIVVLGGVLATKRTLLEWKTVDTNISTYPIDKNEQPWKRILELAYYDLPFQIKPCFLYLGYFPTNLEITTTKLARLWEAEGLVSTSDDDDSGETLEEIAESCLAELVERSLVQVGSRDLAGRAKTCRLHDVMQQLCMNKALKVNWLSVVEVGVKRDQSSDASSKPSKLLRAANRKSRRLAVYCKEKLERLPSDYKHSSYVRSLLFFNTLERDNILIPLKKKALESTFNRYKLLRVLDIENIGVAKLPKNVGNLIHLRYLSLRGSWVSKLPRSIKSLSCLQTLDLRVLTFVRVKIPDVLYRLEWLVHLYLPPKFSLDSKAEKLQLRGLYNLETLANFCNKCKADDVGHLTNLRQFSSCGYIYDEKSIVPLLGLPDSTLLHLEHISLRLDGQYLRSFPNALSSCKSLRKLWVRGEIGGGIHSDMFPQNVIQLSLCGTRFDSDPMPVLGKLPNLKKLSLEHASYEGETMCCPGKAFPKLTHLTLQGLEKLGDWTVEKEAMPTLFSLEINRCLNLKMLPEGLKHVKNLQELNIKYMPFKSFYKGWKVSDDVKSRKEWCDFSKVEHVPSIRHSYVLDLQ